MFHLSDLAMYYVSEEGHRISSVLLSDCFGLFYFGLVSILQNVASNFETELNLKISKSVKEVGFFSCKQNRTHNSGEVLEKLLFLIILETLRSEKDAG